MKASIFFITETINIVTVGHINYQLKVVLVLKLMLVAHFFGIDGAVTT